MRVFVFETDDFVDLFDGNRGCLVTKILHFMKKLTFIRAYSHVLHFEII